MQVNGRYLMHKKLNNFILINHQKMIFLRRYKKYTCQTERNHLFTPYAISTRDPIKVTINHIIVSGQKLLITKHVIISIRGQDFSGYLIIQNGKRSAITTLNNLPNIRDSNFNFRVMLVYDKAWISVYLYIKNSKLIRYLIINHVNKRIIYNDQIKL